MTWIQYINFMMFKNKKFGVKVILHPTVPKGEERIRICLHSFNREQEIFSLFDNLKQLSL